MQTTLAKANNLFREKRYNEALELYRKALQETPVMASSIRFNMLFAEKRQALNSVGASNTSNLPASGGYNTALGGYNIRSTHQLAQNPADPNLWESLGDDPYYLLDPAQFFSAEKSWHRLTLAMRSKKKASLTKMYLDVGQGFSEADTVILPVKSGKVESRVFWVESLPRAMRFDPKEGGGEFRVETIDVDTLSEENAYLIMIERLVEVDEEFSSHTTEAAWKEIQEQAEKNSMNPLKYLYGRYNESFKGRPQTLDYWEWIETVEEPSLPSPEGLQAALEAMAHKPLISIVMPVYNTPKNYLRDCIDSVRAQSYPNWELCIADDKSPKSHVRKILQEYAEKDARIRVVFREENGHISQASNSALEIATGEFVALMDHDDALPEHALFFIAQAINESPDTQIFYSDEDKIDKRGNRFEPHFKSDWNPDLFFSQNYVSHLGVYKRDLLNRIGGFRTGVEGSQDQDLLLRCLPHVGEGEIVHIPRVLYHWRMVEGSTALAAAEKSYTTDAGLTALQDYFAANGPAGARVESGLKPNTYHVCWPIPEPAPLVSLLIPTRDRKAITEVAVRSILDKTTYPNYEIIILDNGSVEEETLQWFSEIQKDERVRVIRYDHPFNYSAINNFGATHAKGSLIGLINNDVEVITPGWLTEMVGHACRESIGCVGAKLYYSNGTLQHAGVIVSLGGVAGHSHKHFPGDAPGYFRRLQLTQNLSAVTAACLIIRKKIYDEVGGLDETNLSVAFNDVDFCLKVREAGYRNLWTPHAELYHHESISRGAEDTPEKQARFAKEIGFMKNKWGNALELDPYYSPNLTRDREDFSIGG